MLDRMKKIKAEEALREETEREKEVVVEESKETSQVDVVEGDGEALQKTQTKDDEIEGGEED